jgi:hypothetical protein
MGWLRGEQAAGGQARIAVQFEVSWCCGSVQNE